MKDFLKVLLASFVGTILAFLIFGFIGIGILIGIASFSSSDEPIIAKESILLLDFKTPITEQKGEQFSVNPMTGNVDMTGSMPLYSFVKAIDAAAEDPGIKFIYMTPESLKMGIAQMEEIRDALKRFRASGKAIISYSTQFGNGSYYLASVSDKVILNPYGDVFILGLSSNMIFFKDLLDRIGVEMQLIRHGKYKAAAEQFVQNDISAENLEQNKTMLNSIWNGWCDEIAESRDFNAGQFNFWIDNLELQNASSALERGLVDELWYSDQVREYLCSLFGVTESKDLKFTPITKYAAARVKTDLRAKEKIAVVYANGEIMVEGNDRVISGIKLSQTLEKVRKDSTIKAVVLRVNSPGGSVSGSEMIHREISLLKEVKPVIASYGNYAASGGYWISAKADKIFTNKSTLTGSIGVFSLVPNLSKTMEKHLHLHSVSITTNKHSDALSGMRALDNAEIAYMQRAVDKIYNDFTAIVSEGRNMTTEQVDMIGQGRVWAGSDALNIGLADMEGGLVDAISYAAEMAGLSQYRLVEYPQVKTTLEKLMESLSKTGADISTLADPFAYIERSYARLKEETGIVNYARLPIVYDIR
ncbi:MAG: signal peptide peptidase SppA [Bacteroidales bacterium]|jgi:protease-4|nr:signal peptide peptidase SppA [Bacteroidales bacterium]